MNTLDLALHLLNFMAPALAVALLVSTAAPLLFKRSSAGTGWWGSFALNLMAGVAVLGIGLWWFGRDGKMATYATLVVAVASSQWLSARAWR